MKKIFYIIIISSFFNKTLYSQIAENDARALIEAYISPLGNSLAAGLNNGWYNTARPHKLGGFDITLTGNFVLINNDVKNYNINDIVQGTMFSGEESPTILGNNTGQEINILGLDSTNTTLKLPGGINLPVLPVPILQAGVGLIKGTEIDVRYIPEINFGKSGKVGMIGFGIKHDLLQWLPIVDKIPIDLSFQAGYTKIRSNIQLIDPDQILPGEGSLANLDITATTINLLLSKKLLMFTPYIGFGYNSNNTFFYVDGKYRIYDDYIPVDALTEFNFENNTTFRTNLGIRFNIALLALQANYTISDYPVFTLGAGISLR